MQDKNLTLLELLTSGIDFTWSKAVFVYDLKLHSWEQGYYNVCIPDTHIAEDFTHNMLLAFKDKLNCKVDCLIGQEDTLEIGVR